MPIQSPPKTSYKRLESLIWSLIYGGLFMLLIGLIVRNVAGGWSHAMVAVGVLAAVVGVVLIVVRARLGEGG